MVGLVVVMIFCLNDMVRFVCLESGLFFVFCQNIIRGETD